MKLFSVLLLTFALLGSSQQIQANETLEINQEEGTSLDGGLEARAKRNCDFFRNGKRGPTGPQGPKGDAGVAGATGAQGATGPCCIGPTGASVAVAFGQVTSIASTCAGNAGCFCTGNTGCCATGCGPAFATLCIPANSPNTPCTTTTLAPTTTAGILRGPISTGTSVSPPGVLGLLSNVGTTATFYVTYNFSGYIFNPYVNCAHGLLFRLAVETTPPTVLTAFEQTVQRFDGEVPIISQLCPPVGQNIVPGFQQFLPINVSGSGYITLSPGQLLVLQLTNTKETPINIGGISCSITAELKSIP